MNEIIKIETVDQYNKLFGLETLHPLVSVVDLSKAAVWPGRFTFHYDVYCLYLKATKCGSIRYGRQNYDYQEGSVVSFAPGQTALFEIAEGSRPSGQGVLFHPDLIRGTSLGGEIKSYSFFSYESNEALHLSEKEKEVIEDCFKNIQSELNRSIDKHSKRLISKNIELLLDYCMRFYDRQFITRLEANKDIIARFDRLLDAYFEDERLRQSGLPTVRYFADKVFLSPNYFGDLIKKETGKTAQEYIQHKVMEIAKDRILGTRKTVGEIAYDLGFQYSQHFNRVFKKNVGHTPSEYRKLYS